MSEEFTDEYLIRKYWEAAEDGLSPTKDISDALVSRGLAYVRDATADEIEEWEDEFGDFGPTKVLELSKLSQPKQPAIG